VLAVRSLTAKGVPAVRRIVCDLPDYFTSDVPGQIERDIARHDGWVLTDSGEAVGFAVASRRSPGAVEILWMAVDPSRRGHGLGTVLLERMLGELPPTVSAPLSTCDRARRVCLDGDGSPFRKRKEKCDQA
jgi:GNAT superfamily N-acetyltransferase